MHSDKNKKLTIRIFDDVLLTAQDIEEIVAAMPLGMLPTDPPPLGIRIDETVQMNEKVGG